MAKKDIGGNWTRDSRNAINSNFTELYGSESGLQAQIDNIIVEGDSSVEAAAARVAKDGESYATLKARLDAENTEVTEKLAEKADYSDVRKIKIPINTSDLSQGVLDALQGGEGTSVNVLSIPKEKSVDPKKTTFLKSSTNLFNKNDISVGYNIGSNGELVDSVTHGTSDFIPCVPDGFYSYNRIAKFVWYDENYTLIASRSQLSPTQAYDIAYYMRVVIEMKHLNNLIQLNEGKTLLSFEGYKTEFKKEENFIFPDKPNADYFGRLVGDPEFINFAWNERKLRIEGKSSRLLFKGDSYLIPSQNVDLPFTGWHKILYDTVNQKVELIKLNEETPKDKIVFGTLSGNMKIVNYIENYYVDGARVKDDGIAHSVKLAHYITPDVPSGWYESGVVEGYEATTQYTHDITLGTVYDVFDRLVTENPSYVTKETHGRDSTDVYTMYSYEFKPEEVESTLFKKKMPKVIIFTNTHGEEKSSTISIRNFMRDVCDKWQSDPLLEFIRFNVHLVIMPVVNPYGFVKNTRKNGNGVDINRNNSHRWATSDNTDPGATTYKGTSALSEKEAQYVRDIIVANKDAIACYDYHMNGSSGSVYDTLFWHYIENFQGVAGFSGINTIAKTDISRLTREGHKRYNIPNNSGYLGYISYNTSSSTIAAFAFSEGVPAMTIECTKKMVDEANVYSAKTMQLCTEFIGNTILNTVREFSK